MFQRITCFAVLLICTLHGFTQINPSGVPLLFSEESIARFDVYIPEDSLNLLLEDLTSDHEYIATCVYNNFAGVHDTIEDIGFRIRGNVSRLDEKKSFKISLNTYQPGRKYLGVEKINLKATGDASFVRPKLCWYLCRQMGIPYVWVNHVQLYINGELWGLYLNVEHVDEEFIEKRFGENDGNLYKCRYPSDLAWISNNQNDYKFTEIYFGDREKRVYELKTNTSADDYTDLMELTDVLSNSSDNEFKGLIESKINIHSLLKFLALEVYMGHWDSYSYWGNNYFLYHNSTTDKFEYITYDMDLTMGISFAGDDIATKDIYAYEDEMSSRNLRSRVLSVPEYRAYYSFYMKQLVDLNPPDTLRKKARAIQDFIEPAVETDPFYNLPIEEFYSSLDDPIGMASYGVIDFLSQRHSAILDQLDVVNIAPIINAPVFSDHAYDDTITIRFKVVDDDTLQSVKLKYKVNDEAETTLTPTLTHFDTANSTWNYQVEILPVGTPGLIQFTIEATDNWTNTTINPGIGAYVLRLYKGSPDIRINEILSSNGECMTDEYGEHEDWIELHNADTVPFDLSLMYLSDSYQNPTDWKLPEVILQPGEYIWFWADDDTDQGEFHADFKLSRSGETIYLFEKRNNFLMLLDSMAYPEQERDVSYGYANNQSENCEALTKITPGKANETSGLSYLTFKADMSALINNNVFNEVNDEVDVIANLNNWTGSDSFLDMDKDSVYVRTVFDLDEGEEIAYRYRVNKDNSKIEFVKIGGNEGHRKVVLQEGCNTVKHLFGMEETSEITPLPKLKLSLYPTSVSDRLFINSSDVLKRAEIFSLEGKLYRSHELQDTSAEISVTELPSGMYLIRIQSDNGKEFTGKFVK